MRSCIIAFDKVFAHDVWYSTARHAGCELIVLDWEQIVDKLVVKSNKKSNYINISEAISIDLNKITGILQCQLCPPSTSLQMAKKNWQYYNMAWQAWWLAMQNKVSVIINRIDHEMLSPEFWSLPNIYLQAKYCEIAVPNWQLDTRGQIKISMQSYSAISRCLGQVNFMPINVKNNFSIVHSSGHAVLCLVVDDTVFYKTLCSSQGSIKLKKATKAKLIILVKRLKLSVAEIFFRVTYEQVWILYHIQPNPTWRYWMQNQATCAAIWQMFKHEKKSTRSFAIPQSQRPELCV